jgi:DNA-binding MarR family transcriptional regulator
VGALLRPCWQWVWNRIYAGVAAAGYDDLNPAHVALFRYPTLDRLRPTEIAEQMQITKQSVNELLGHLERHGYLRRESDPKDGRARVVRLTSKGHQLEAAINAQAKAAELEIGELFGPRRFAELRAALEEFAAYTAEERPEPPV